MVKSGDVVKLKSGGPPMTVDDVDRDATGETKAWCVWFDSKGERKIGVFKPEALEPALG